MAHTHFKSLEEWGHEEQARRRRTASQLVPSLLRSTPSDAILRVEAEFASHAGPAAVQECREIVLDWMQDKLKGKLPRKARRHRSFSHRSGASGCRAVRVRNERGDYWAAQLERSPGTGQALITEVVVAHPSGQFPAISIEIVDKSVVPAESLEQYPAEMLAAMAARVPLLQEGRRLSHEPIVVETAEMMQGFHQMLVDPGREMPFAVISVPPDPEDPKALRAQWRGLARALTGVAIVWVLPPAMTYRLSDLVSKNLSVFLGAWRFYRPGFDHRAERSDHPLVLKVRMEDELGLAETTRQFLRMAAVERQRAMSDSAETLGYYSLEQEEASSVRGPARLVAFLRSSIRGGPAPASRTQYPAAADSGPMAGGQLLTDRAADNTPPAAAAVHEPQPAMAPAAVADETPLLRRKLRAATDKARARASRYERAKQRADVAERERDEARMRVEQLAGLVRSLGGNPDAETPFPTAWADFAPWCEENLAGRVALTGSARREVSGADYEDVGLAARCLNWLASDYRDGRVLGGEAQLHGRIEDIEEGVHNLPCGGDSFDCTWDGEAHRVEWHIKRGANTRDPRRCLRIYYFWDERSRQVVIVSMPAHRRSALT